MHLFVVELEALFRCKSGTATVFSASTGDKLKFVYPTRLIRFHGKLT